MKRYFAIYRCLLLLNYRRALLHKTDFFNGLFASILWGIFSILAIYILTARSTSVFGWSRTELFVLIGVYNILIGGVFRMFFSRNFDRFVQVIQRAELDGVLLKPFNAQFALSFWYVSYHSLFRVLLSIVYTVLVLSLAHIPLTIFSIVTFILCGVLGITILYAIWFLVMTLIIWFPDLYNMVELLFTVDTLSRYPPQVLWSMRLAIFVIFFPLTFVVSIPTKALLHKLTVSDSMILAVTAGVLLFLSVRFWKFALRYYTSASG